MAGGNDLPCCPRFRRAGVWSRERGTGGREGFDNGTVRCTPNRGARLAWRCRKRKRVTGVRNNKAKACFSGMVWAMASTGSARSLTPAPRLSKSPLLHRRQSADAGRRARAAGLRCHRANCRAGRVTTGRKCRPSMAVACQSLLKRRQQILPVPRAGSEQLPCQSQDRTHLGAGWKVERHHDVSAADGQYAVRIL